MRLSTRWTKRALVPAFALGLVHLASAPAHAWDAADPDQVVTRAKQRPYNPFPFRGTSFNAPNATGRDTYFFSNGLVEEGYAHYSNSGAHRYGVRYLHEVLAGSPGAPAVAFAPGLYSCNEKPQDAHLENYGCEPWSSGTAVKWPWVNMRKAWVDPDPRHAGKEHDEHAALARYAAQIAGLPPTLGETFWLRYPAPNQLIASPAGSKWIVGPSWKPLDMASESSSTLRPITLYELAQMPDHAFAVWSWAAGNEECPLDGLDWGFPRTVGDPGNRRCNDYMSSIGPLNATHMLPASKSIYHYYHQLALKRMTECKVLSTALSSFYQPTGDWAPVWSSNDTEMHQCEREAFVYEMFAQHFLQDAWATGHMWHRWGYTEPSQFPATLNDAYHLTWDKPLADVPPENLAGRRAFLAGVVGGFVGMVHGTKAVAEKKVPEFVAETPLIDDPLNGPWFIDWLSLPRRVRWQDANGFNSPGAGDLFANLVLRDGSTTYEPWRDRFMMCSALSMRQLYESGPQAHGPLISFLGKFDRSEFDDFDTKCWSQRATNDSMLGSVLPLPLAYNMKVPVPVILPWSRTAGVPVGPAAFAFFNHMVIDQLSQTPAMPNTPDRDVFIKNIERRMLLDQQSVVFDYLANVTLDALGNATFGVLGNLDGTESAQGRRVASLSGDNVIRFLNVEPNQPLPGTPPVSFMDLPEPAVPEGDRPQSYYVRHMFWRGHPEDTCQEPGLAARLRDACIAAAEDPPGDPEACTRCVEVAELQMPGCGMNGAVPAPSKCQALGLPSLGGIDPIYGTSACATQLNLDVLPAYYSALHYCTGTDPLQFDRESLIGEKRLSASPQVRVDCSAYPGFDPIFGTDSYYTPTARFRYALVINEHAPQGYRELGPDGDPHSFLPPIVTAVVDERTQTFIDGPSLCSLSQEPFAFALRGVREESSLDELLESQIHPLSLWDNYGRGMHALPRFDFERPDTLHFERCGVTQRVSYHNRECRTALAALGRGDLIPQIDQGFDRQTGVEVRLSIGAEELRCSVFEEVQLKTLCSLGECNANGLCTRFDAAPVVAFHAQ